MLSVADMGEGGIKNGQKSAEKIFNFIFTDFFCRALVIPISFAIFTNTRGLGPSGPLSAQSFSLDASILEKSKSFFPS